MPSESSSASDEEEDASYLQRHSNATPCNPPSESRLVHLAPAILILYPRVSYTAPSSSSDPPPPTWRANLTLPISPPPSYTGRSPSLNPGAEPIGNASPVLPSMPRIGSTFSIEGDTGGDALDDISKRGGSEHSCYLHLSLHRRR
ncbi:hypothetical protein Adt_04724 [Abeliophyllum distichum]|uniref:Uncharacterized protein n=1 Tax=Abeliophyllum distichum TaxID=126358 RepID=A0ABD1V237_9LAMI